MVHSLCSFGNFPGVRSIKADVSELHVGSIAQDNGTDIEFRNVGFYTSDAGEIPIRTQTTLLASSRLSVRTEQFGYQLGAFSCILYLNIFRKIRQE